MTNRSGWIDLLFKRHTAVHALQTGFLLDLTRKLFVDEAESRPGGRAELRSAALEELSAGSEEAAALALVVLSAVGRADDLKNVEPYLDHSSDLVRRAARACRFQLKR